MIGPSRPSEPPVEMTASDAAARRERRPHAHGAPTERDDLDHLGDPRRPPPAANSARSDRRGGRPPPGGRSRSDGGSDSAPRTMSSAPTRGASGRTDSARKPIAPSAPARPAAAARRRNWVLGSRQKKRPKREGRAGGGSGELILHFVNPGSAPPRPTPLPRRRRRRGRRVTAEHAAPSGRNSPRRPSYGRWAARFKPYEKASAADLAASRPERARNEYTVAVPRRRDAPEKTRARGSFPGPFSAAAV